MGIVSVMLRDAILGGKITLRVGQEVSRIERGEVLGCSGLMFYSRPLGQVEFVPWSQVKRVVMSPGKDDAPVADVANRARASRVAA